MNESFAQPTESLKGAIAGLAGTVVMLAMRSFDEKYAPMTVPESRVGPGASLLKPVESTFVLAGKTPNSLARGATVSLSLGYGIIAGILYANIRGRRSNASPLIDGGLIGIALYAIGWGGWLPLLRLARPIWKQSFPEIAGEALRHIVFGVTTAAICGAIESYQPGGSAFDAAQPLGIAS